jgi:hypothetical protein
MKRRTLPLSLATLLLAVAFPAAAQSQPGQPQAADQPPAPTAAAAPGQIPTGTRLLIGLLDDLSTKEDKQGKSFRARTLAPVVAPDGTVVLDEGLEVHGHIDKVEAATKTGRARLWLTFDEIQTPAGPRPLVAQLIDAPGVHSIRVAYNREGQIETNAAATRQREAEAAAAGAMAGAAATMSSKDKKDIAIGAAVGAVTAFMITSGLGQEITLPTGTKLEIVLERPLFFGRT